MEADETAESTPQIEALQLESVERYLTYNNPIIVSFPNHTFVSSALFAAKSLSILPNSSVCNTFFSTQRPDTYHIQSGRHFFQAPIAVSEVQAHGWKDHIGSELIALRQQRTPVPAKIVSIVTGKNHEMSYTGLQSQPRIETQAQHISAVAEQFHLNVEQRRAYDIFLRPLMDSPSSTATSSDDSANRCMYLGGPGGTGKSRVIQAIVEVFNRLGYRDQLLICATTGVAANLIGGSTVDSLAKIRRRGGRYKETDDTQQGMDSSDHSYVVDNTWMRCNFLILDEVSMLGCVKLAKISQALQRNKSNSLAFGGIRVLFSGDFFQLPAIGDTSLYHQSCKRKHNAQMVEMGMNLWRNVITTTVLLTKHYRAPNPEVYNVMERLRKGTLIPSDVEKIKSRVFGHPMGPDPLDPKWQDAPLITPRNNIRQAWNNQAAIRYSIRNDSQVFISPAIDSGICCDRHTRIWTGDHKTEMLATWNVLCVGSIAVVTANTAVELNMANGSKVIIREVVPHPEDTEGWRSIQTERVVCLSRPPIAVWVESVSGPAQKLLNLHPQNHPHWFPIMPMKQTITIPQEYGPKASTQEKNTFEWIQIQLTSAFAMSDFRVQGNGLTKGIFDLKKPPSGRLLCANIYVMLSRVSNWEDLAILRPFEDSVLSGKADEELLTYEKILEDMNRETLRREEQRSM